MTVLDGISGCSFGTELAEKLFIGLLELVNLKQLQLFFETSFEQKSCDALKSLLWSSLSVRIAMGAKNKILRISSLEVSAHKS